MLTLDVRGLPKSMTEDGLRQLFALHGRIFNMQFARDMFSGECRGFAAIDMEGHEARSAVAALNGSTQDGAMIRVALHDARKRHKGHR